MLHTASHTGV
ncbi:hypothetical protein F383_15771 [Gossypium arboreum]|uniref:Uncharacterized protein n=1 Tax=Gossypium arboreum TaxID=29729 RepID=A0A0B0PUZ0_GOSAR|nr:hypothetical protein F383_15771 [Gossypium arboreum]